MSREKYTDQELQQQLAKLDHFAPPGWDMEHSWEKLERIRGREKIRFWGYLERVAAVILLLAMVYGYVRQERANGKRVLAEAFVNNEYEQGNQSSTFSSVGLVEKEESVLSLPSPTNIKPLSPVISSKEDHTILSDIHKKPEKKNIDQIGNQAFMTELMEVDTTRLIDSTLRIAKNENERNQTLVGTQVEKENKRPPIIHFNRPEIPSSEPNRKLKVRLRKLDRMITKKSNKKTIKYQYVGRINLRKP